MNLWIIFFILLLLISVVYLAPATPTVYYNTSSVTFVSDQE